MTKKPATLISSLALSLCLLASGCALLESTFDHTMGNVRDLPPDAPNPTWQVLISDFVYTLLIGATGGTALYAGVIRPRRKAKEAQKKVDETS